MNCVESSLSHTSSRGSPTGEAREPTTTAWNWTSCRAVCPRQRSKHEHKRLISMKLHSLTTTTETSERKWNDTSCSSTIEHAEYTMNERDTEQQKNRERMHEKRNICVASSLNNCRDINACEWMMGPVGRDNKESKDENKRKRAGKRNFEKTTSSELQPNEWRRRSSEDSTPVPLTRWSWRADRVHWVVPRRRKGSAP